MLKTLIADDNVEHVKRLMNEVINKIDDIQVECLCTDGKEVVENISNKSFDLILLDLQMPKVNGIEIIKFIRALDLVKFPKIIMHIFYVPHVHYPTYYFFIKSLNCNFGFKFL